MSGLKSLQTFSVLNQDHDVSFTLTKRCLNITAKTFNNAVVCKRILYCKFGYFDGKQMRYVASDPLCTARRCQDLLSYSRCNGWRLMCGPGALKSTTTVQTAIGTSSLSVCDLHQSPKCCRGNDYQLYQLRAADTRLPCRLHTHKHVCAPLLLSHYECDPLLGNSCV